MHDSDAKKPRGRSAIQAAHGGVTSEDEGRLDLMISDLYGVDGEEAAEIHLNYHLDRLVAGLVRRGSEKGVRTGGKGQTQRSRSNRCLIPLLKSNGEPG
jgi:hypothetical protein